MQTVRNSNISYNGETSSVKNVERTRVQEYIRKEWREKEGVV